MQDQDIRSCIAYFLLVTNDERMALQLATKIYKKLHNDKYSASTLIRSCHELGSKNLNTFMDTSSVNKIWDMAKKKLREEDLTAYIFCQVLNFSRKDVGRAFHVTVNTIERRIAKAALTIGDIGLAR